MGLILGIDICDDCSQISSYDTSKGDVVSITLGGEGAAERIPTVICKKNGIDDWLVGEEAFRTALVGGGTLIDRLIKLVGKNGSATIEGEKFVASRLMGKYVEKLIDLAKRRYGEEEIDELVFTVHEPGPRINDVLNRVATSIGIPEERVHIYSHTECFAYYILNQPNDIWNNQVSLFDLRENGLFYYELRAIRGRRPIIIEASREKLPDSFEISILDTTAGEKLADTILSSCAKRVLDKKIISSVVLTGRGFETTNWASDFLEYVCNRRRVFQCSQIFAQGAAFAAYNLFSAENEGQYLMICDGRLSSNICVNALYEGRKEQIVLGEAGTNWYEAGVKTTFILDEVNELEVLSKSVIDDSTKKFYVSLDELPARPRKTTRIELSVTFSSEHRMLLKVKDLGFGELFPSSDITIKEEVNI